MPREINVKPAGNLILKNGSNDSVQDRLNKIMKDNHFVEDECEPKKDDNNVANRTKANIFPKNIAKYSSDE